MPASDRIMEPIRIERAVQRLERNLPLRHNQLRLPQSLRQLHQSILRHYLENGRAPAADEIEFAGCLKSALQRLAADNIILLDRSGLITGAYPFVDEAREFRVVSEFGGVNAMCAFDALAISSMFALPTRIESRCRITACPIVIEQDDDELRLIEPELTVFGAIDWNARDSRRSCAASLCTEMMFIAGNESGASWRDEAPATRELFSLDEAQAFISAVFIPLMQAR